DWDFRAEYVGVWGAGRFGQLVSEGHEFRLRIDHETFSRILDIARDCAEIEISEADLLIGIRSWLNTQLKGAMESNFSRSISAVTQESVSMERKYENIEKKHGISTK